MGLGFGCLVGWVGVGDWFVDGTLVGGVFLLLGSGVTHLHEFLLVEGIGSRGGLGLVRLGGFVQLERKIADLSDLFELVKGREWEIYKKNINKGKKGGVGGGGGVYIYIYRGGGG